MRAFHQAVAVSVIAGAAHVVSADTSVIYNHVSDTRTQLDDAVRERFARRYKVVEFTDKDHSWVYPRLVTRSSQTLPVYRDGRCIPGQALVAYVISVDGSVSDGFAAQSTDSFLGLVAVQLAKEKRFAPGKLDGRPVASVAASKFSFPCPSETK
jgi:hypothetical protein